MQCYCVSVIRNQPGVTMNDTTSTLVFFVNGKKISDSQINPEWTLLFYLRRKLNLCGTKLGCGEGGCGACTVMVSKFDRRQHRVVHVPVNACLAPVCAMHGLAVTTIEGIGSTRTKLHPVQERIAKAHGSQCGFCTPGIVMSMYTLLRNTQKPNMKQLEVAFQGNLCRCTGYRPILEGYRTFTEEWEQAEKSQKVNSRKDTNSIDVVNGDSHNKVTNGYTSADKHSRARELQNTNGHQSLNPNQKMIQDINYQTKTKQFVKQDTPVISTTTSNKSSVHDNSTTNSVIYSNGSYNLSSENRSNGSCPMGKRCCKFQAKTQTSNDETKEQQNTLFKPSEFTPYHVSQEPIFPPELKLIDQYDQQTLVVKGNDVTWYRPITLTQLLTLKHQHPEGKLVVGNSEIGVETKLKKLSYPILIHSSQIFELNEVKIDTYGITVGASVTLNDFQQFLQQQVNILPDSKCKIFKAIIEMLHWFAGPQIRSVCSIGGNIMTGSPISDLISILMAAKTKMIVQSYSEGEREVFLDGNFFTGYRKNIITPREVLKTIYVPYSSKDQYFYAYKQSRRREDDIAIVNFAINVTFEPNSEIISRISLAFGGMSFKVVTAPKTENTLTGLSWNSETLEVAYECLLEDLPLAFDAPGGLILYRKSLALSLFYKAFLKIAQDLQQYIPNIIIDPKLNSATAEFNTTEFKSSQCFSVAGESQRDTDPIQRPIVHMSAYKQATGEAIYCDDIPHFENELYMDLILSTKSHAKILSIDVEKALAIPGVHGFISSNDISPEKNKTGTFLHDEKVFYSDKVTSQGQIIGVIIADDESKAQMATRCVNVKYEELQPVILTIEDAIEEGSFFEEFKRVMVNGDVEKAFIEAPHILVGECRTGGQEHFYMETQSVIAVPVEDEMHLYTSSQHPTEVTQHVSKVLDLPQHKVIAKVKRLGGGFGGKESKASLIAVPAAVAASRFGRPVRCVLDRDEDMVMTGGRHPFLVRYKVGFDEGGKILAADVTMYSNCGYSADLSFGVLGRAMNHFENAYHIPVSRVSGFACRTNLPSNTAFRGFGGPQGMYVAECMIQDIAEFLNKDVTHLRGINLYNEGQFTHYKQQLVDCTLRRCWNEVIASSDYQTRRKLVEKYNEENRYKKRGLSVIPTKFGIGYSKAFMNQGGALVLVYTDGSVLLTHGGIEMGQGLHTKMIQVASRELDIPTEWIHIRETSTDKVPNTTATAASTGSDINGVAVMEACRIIKSRLQPFKEANLSGSWTEWVKAAYMERVSLSATGFCKTPDVGYDFEKGEGRMFNYFTYGAAVTEVEIDTLTGDHQILRTDIVMDLGQSLNPAIDIGQIEGAFMQGYGLFVMEEMVYSSDGTIFTRGPSTYKIPGFGDIPREFNVSLLKGSSNPRAVYSSKAVGEPPLFLASSVFFAIKDAITAARQESRRTVNFTLHPPATADKIRLACQDDITRKVGQLPDPSTFKPWNILI